MAEGLEHTVSHPQVEEGRLMKVQGTKNAGKCRRGAGEMETQENA